MVGRLSSFVLEQELFAVRSIDSQPLAVELTPELVLVRNVAQHVIPDPPRVLQARKQGIGVERMKFPAGSATLERAVSHLHSRPRARDATDVGGRVSEPAREPLAVSLRQRGPRPVQRFERRRRDLEHLADGDDGWDARGNTAEQGG